MEFYGFEFSDLCHLILLIMMFYFVLLLLNKESVLKRNIQNNEDIRLFIITSPVVMVISLFANYSYKLVFIFIIATVIHKNINNIEKTILYLFFFTNPLVYDLWSLRWNNLDEISLFFVNRICSYYLNFLIIKIFTILSRNLLIKLN